MNNTINDLKVNITAAKLLGIKFDSLDGDELPGITVEVQLLTALGEPVTTIYIYTRRYSHQTGPQYIHVEDIPASVYASLGDIVKHLKGPIMRNLNSIEKVLEYKGE